MKFSRKEQRFQKNLCLFFLALSAISTLLALIFLFMPAPSQQSEIYAALRDQSLQPPAQKEFAAMQAVRLYPYERLHWQKLEALSGDEKRAALTSKVLNAFGSSSKAAEGE